ncbi:TRAP transporter large permease [Treponema phagedenis]|uniref:TRAP transporter large permease n=1 Tax=Treponema phagedenis TaxID=162 RepID=UPI0011E8973C|nr:TRAP transporter large permease [Treponema phagedenis]QEJ99752.1 TRAP transporter large permease [Treponema phagedenis]
MNIMVLSGILMIVVLAILLINGVPIGVTIGIASIAGILPTLNFEAAVVTSAQRIFSGISVFTLLAIPFFILAGNLMNKGGIALRLINLAKLLFGKLPGGLALSNIFANMLFGSISGSGIAAASAIGSIIGPIEKEDGYDINFSAATNIVSAPTGLLIPPSNVLITYSLISGGTSVGALFLAGYIPGILWGIGCIFLGMYIAKKEKYVGTDRPGLKESLKIIWESIPSLLLIVIVIGGIIKGVFTATEASCVAVLYSLLLAILYRSITVKELMQIIRTSAEMTGIIMLIIGTSNIMGWVMSFTGIPEMVSNQILGITGNKYIILLLMNVILLLVGTFMDITPAVLIFTPIFLPICESFGMDPIHFGIMITFNLCIGGITPPVGNILYIGTKVGKTRVEDVMPWVVKYYGVILFVLLLVTFIPSLSLFLPNALGLN